MEVENKLGLSLALLNKLTDTFSSCPDIEKVVVFGSRAQGRAKNNSDIHLAVYGKNLTKKELNLLEDKLMQLDTPLEFDLVNFDSLNKATLKENIERDGVEIYARKKTERKV